jgi:hypothetical protein
MMSYKLFSLEEARRLIPELKGMLKEANDELAEKLVCVQAANECYEQSEQELDSLSESPGIERLRAVRARFQDAIQQLSESQDAYVNRLNFWVDLITGTGVILRDIRDGLLDFPCEANGFTYLLCWRMDEADINFWHLANDGFTGRKPLSALAEYM